MAANGYQQHVVMGNFDVAINEENTDGSEITTWYRSAAWNGLGEVCAAHLAKGRKVMVVGSRLSASTWTGRSADLRTTLALTTDTVKVLDAPVGRGKKLLGRRRGRRVATIARPDVESASRHRGNGADRRMSRCWRRFRSECDPSPRN